MSTLTRDDGTQFVIQAYRELIQFKKRSLLSQRVREISAQQGQFVRLFRKSSSEYEAVFSSEPGYLLGESVKQYFQQSNELLFIEAVKESVSEVLLIVIHKGNVFYDTIVSIEQLQEELLPLTTLQTSFHAVIAGNIPKLDQENFHATLSFPKQFIETVEHLDEPLLPRLPNIPTVRLLPLPLALKAERLNGDFYLLKTVSLATVFIVTISFSVFFAHEHYATKKINKQPPPFQVYYTALQSADPVDLLDAYMQDLETCYMLSGWQPKRMTQQGNRNRIKLASEGGSLQLLEWQLKRQYAVDLESDGVYLTHAFKSSQRHFVQQPSTVHPLLEKLIDSLNDSFLDVRTTLNRNVQHAQSKEVKLSLHFNHVAPAELQTLKRILFGMPVVIKSIDFTFNSDTLLNGSIELSVWGV